MAHVQHSKRFDVTDQIIAYENGDLDDLEIIDLFQFLIDSGMAWQLQGAYGRMAIRLLKSGECYDRRTES